MSQELQDLEKIMYQAEGLLHTAHSLLNNREVLHKRENEVKQWLEEFDNFLMEDLLLFSMKHRFGRILSEDAHSELKELARQYEEARQQEEAA